MARSTAVRWIRVVIALGALGAVLLVTAAVSLKAYRVPSEAMKPTLDVGSHILVRRLAYEPHVGDIVVFHAPAIAKDARCSAPHPRRAMCVAPADELSDVTFIKRIVAGPGDRVSLSGGRLIRNGEPESGYKLAPCGQYGGCDFPVSATVPKGHWFVLGDNRGASDDSRFWGTIPSDAVIGEYLLTYIS
jgi:signal peptidase I